MGKGHLTEAEELARQRQESKLREQQRLEELAEQKRLLEETRSKAKQALQGKLSSQKAGKGIWEKYSYQIIFGLLGLILLLAILGKTPNETRRSVEIDVNEETFIKKVNKDGRPYQVGPNSFFNGWTLYDVKQILKNGFTKKKSVPRCPPTSNELQMEKYLFSDKYPNCVRPVQNQGNCSSSFAFAIAGVYTDRFCVANEGTKTFTASPQHALACDKVGSKGCLGGYLVGSLDLGRVAGFVNDECLPYNPSAADTCDAKSLKSCKRSFVTDYCVAEGVNEIKNQISSGGPVAALVQVTREFLIYKGGVYDETLSDYKLDGLQAVKIVGWDEDTNGQEYWIIENSWGSDWGENGFAKIKMNVLDAMIDKFAVGCNTNSEKKKDEEKRPDEE
jgi:cathepsin B